MGYLIIPTMNAQTYGNFSQTVSLDGIDYQLQYKYNDRESFWYFNLLDTEDNPIKTGIKIVSNWPFLRNVVNTTRPGGELIGVDTRQPPLDPGFDDLGFAVKMGYIEEDELA
jgi:hypothetical protein